MLALPAAGRGRPVKGGRVRAFFWAAYHLCRRLSVTPNLTTMRNLTMLTAIFDTLPDLSLPDTFDFDLTLHVHVQR